MRKKPTPTSRSHSCAAAPRSPCAAGESLHSPTLTLPGAFQNPLGIGPPSAEEIPSMSPASSRYQRSRSSQTLQDHPEDDPPQGAQPDPETLSDSSLACEILSQQPRNKTWGASNAVPGTTPRWEYWLSQYSYLRPRTSGGLFNYAVPNTAALHRSAGAGTVVGIVTETGNDALATLLLGDLRLSVHMRPALASSQSLRRPPS